MTENERLEGKKTGKHRILTPEERRERNRQEMIDAILAVSRDIMREEGVGGLNLHEVARRVGMSAPSLYNYFPSKMAIYEAVFARGMRLYRQQTEQVLVEHGFGAEGRRAAITHFMAFALESPELFHLLFERPVPGFVPSEEGIDEAHQLIALSDRIAEQQRAAVEIDESIPLDQARDLFVALMHGLTALHLANEPHLPVGEGRFGGLISLAARAIELVYNQGLPVE
jgi:AcrR family transcriptional regulator